MGTSPSKSNSTIGVASTPLTLEEVVANIEAANSISMKYYCLHGLFWSFHLVHSGHIVDSSLRYTRTDSIERAPQNLVEVNTTPMEFDESTKRVDSLISESSTCREEMSSGHMDRVERHENHSSDEAVQPVYRRSKSGSIPHGVSQITRVKVQLFPSPSALHPNESSFPPLQGPSLPEEMGFVDVVRVDNVPSTVRGDAEFLSVVDPDNLTELKSCDIVKDDSTNNESSTSNLETAPSCSFQEYDIDDPHVYVEYVEAPPRVLSRVPDQFFTVDTLRESTKRSSRSFGCLPLASNSHDSDIDIVRDPSIVFHPHPLAVLDSGEVDYNLDSALKRRDKELTALCTFLGCRSARAVLRPNQLSTLRLVAVRRISPSMTDIDSSGDLSLETNEKTRRKLISDSLSMDTTGAVMQLSSTDQIPLDYRGFHRILAILQSSLCLLHPFAPEIAISDESLCCICLDRHASVVLQCKHNFCYSCAKSWNSEHFGTCPLCRQAYDPDSAENWIIPTPPSDRDVIEELNILISGESKRFASEEIDRWK